MKINWKVRIKNKVFWATIIPALFVLVKALLALFGIEMDLNEIQGRIMNLLDAVFLVLGILGIVVDPTTHSVGDSERALTYEEPFREETR